MKNLAVGVLCPLVLVLTACGGGSSGSKSKSSSSVAVSSAAAVSSVAPASSAASMSSVAPMSSAASVSSVAPVSSAAVSSSSDSSVSSSAVSSQAVSSSSSSSTVALTGVFIDSAVAGISYQTTPGNFSGVTSATGQYQYAEGDTVVFSLGELTFPAVTAKGMLTPVDIAEAAHAGDTTAAETTKINILRLLQSLDKDGDPSNGIQITETVSDQFKVSGLPSVTSANFESEVVSFLPIGVTLVSETEALAHFAGSLQSQLLGSWVFSEGDGKRNVLTFIDEAIYVIIHEHDDGDSQRAGSVEFGRYVWNPETGELTVWMIGQSDESGGLWSDDEAVEGAVTHTLAVNGSELTLGTPNDGAVVFTRVLNNTNPFIGSWGLLEEEDENLNVLTFLSATEYVIAHVNNKESYTNQPNQPLSGEFGTYTLVNGQFQVTGVSVDTDGEGGLYNRENSGDQMNETMDITPWSDLLFGEGNEGTFSFYRIGSFVANLQDYDGEGALGTVTAIRDLSGFTASDLEGKSFTADVETSDGLGMTFHFAFTANGNGIAYASGEGEDESPIEVNWGINSTGTVIVTFVDGAESFTLAIVKLVGDNSDTESKVLLSLVSQEESSLWETQFKMVELWLP